ncbi:anthranilate synthase component I family protein [Campylobacter sp. RM16192]|uniref:anthranilate synthase component I family protein n=1 Tax=Campylobacter sp. RM16192 TaxID=1660080 RepID=UPI001451FCB6|nr:anthranilate synthase component I family protein [Campylobacter sp. RM16192]QCD53241.1 anthranilate synthase component I [Campylobacter sp. RM16192]
MLLLEPLVYYEAIKNKFANSFLAEDSTQAIIGIDCEYISSDEVDFTGLQSYFLAQKHSAPFAGLFGVLGYESVRYFEKIPEFQSSQYEFPNFFYANARAYLHFDKTSKIYTFYGDKAKYYDFLKEIKEPNLTTKESFYQICTDLDKERKHFLDMTQKAKEYLYSGDIFQVVLSEQLKLVSDMDSLEFYKLLSKANPSPYMFHFPTLHGDIVGSSPELVCEIRNSQIFVAPIAGTRGRGKDAIEDERLKNELINDEKELAEHKMLIDLARNDIGRVAKSSSVSVKNPMHVVFYESVMHMASDVYGIKRDDASSFEVVSSVFPAGTLSGTPKIRAMEIISELETYKRNAYGGGIGFFHFNSNVQQAILIRSAVFVPKNGSSEVFIQAGAGIVIDSVAQNEYKEICKKRASVLNVFKNNAREIHK